MVNIKNIVSKSNVQSALAFMMGAAATLALFLDKVTGAEFLVLVVMAFTWAFGKPKSE